MGIGWRSTKVGSDWTPEDCLRGPQNQGPPGTEALCLPIPSRINRQRAYSCAKRQASIISIVEMPVSAYMKCRNLMTSHQLVDRARTHAQAKADTSCTVISLAGAL